MYEEEIHFGRLLLKQSDMVLEHLTPVTLTFSFRNPRINRVHMLTRMDVRTEFKEDRSRRSRLETKRQTDRRTYRHVQSNSPSILRRGEGGIHIYKFMYPDQVSAKRRFRTNSRSLE